MCANDIMILARVLYGSGHDRIAGGTHTDSFYVSVGPNPHTLAAGE